MFEISGSLLNMDVIKEELKDKIPMVIESYLNEVRTVEKYFQSINREYKLFGIKVRKNYSVLFIFVIYES